MRYMVWEAGLYQDEPADSNHQCPGKVEYNLIFAVEIESKD